MEKKISIFVACHKAAHVLDNPLLVPVQVGAKLARDRLQGMLYDDEGENISNKNPIYCELTAQYWAWKNVDSDYYGFFHYRRYLAFDTVYPVDSNGHIEIEKNPKPYVELDDLEDDLSAYHLREDSMRRVIEKHDMVTMLRERINTTVYRQYCQYHPQAPLDRVLEILKEKYPAYQWAVEQYMNSKEVYYMNMYIMKKTLFTEYASWLFDILETYEKDEDFPKDGNTEKRIMGYLAERLFGVFYTYQRGRGLMCAELPYLRFYNTGDDEKNKAKDIRTFQLKPTHIQLNIDMRKFNKLFPAGTRRRIWIRNIFLR